MVHQEQSRQVSGLDFHFRVLNTFQVVPSSLGSPPPRESNPLNRHGGLLLLVYPALVYACFSGKGPLSGRVELGGFRTTLVDSDR